MTVDDLGTCQKTVPRFMGKNIDVDILCSADMVTSQAWMMQPKVVERSYVLAVVQPHWT